MRTQLFALGAAAAVLSAGLAQATPAKPTLTQVFADRARSHAEALVNTCGVDLAREAVTVQAYVGAEGRLKSVQVIGSTGPRESDRVIEQALKDMPLDDVPPQLIDARLTFHFGSAGRAVR